MWWQAWMRTFLLLLSALVPRPARGHETFQWNYERDVMGGPEFWGLLDRRWEMCAKGKLQSPVNIAPSRLLFDPLLRPVHVDRVRVFSELVNTGQMARVRIANSLRHPAANLSGGPLGGYRYRIQRIDLHFGRGDLNGSEHSIDGRRFPMEIQILAYNSDIYANFSTAVKSPHGIASIAILVEVGDKTNEELEKLTAGTASIQRKNKRVEIADLKPWLLLPYTRDFITYEGSMTSPGCHETVTWILVNQPIHITSDHLSEWGRLMQNEEGNEENNDFLAPNSRATQELNGRLVRTNIAHREPRECVNRLPKLTYRTNSNLTEPPTGQRHKRRHEHREDAVFDKFL